MITDKDVMTLNKEDKTQLINYLKINCTDTYLTTVSDFDPEHPNKNFRCPFRTHTDKNPSASYDPRTKRVKCFSCNDSQDVLGLAGKVKGLKYLNEEIADVCNACGIDPRQPEHFSLQVSVPVKEDTPIKEKEQGVPSLAWQNATAGIVHRASAYLWNSGKEDARNARKYLMTDRGLSEETLRKYEIGFNPVDRDYTYMGDDGRYRSLRTFKGITIPGFRGDLSGTVYDNHVPELMYVKVRREDLARYVMFSGSHASMYAEWNIRTAGTSNALLCEGEMDVLTIDTLTGSMNSPEPFLVMPFTFGSVSTINQTVCDKKCIVSPREFLIVMDNDRSGRSGSERAQKIINDIRIPAGATPARIVELPDDYKDINDLYTGKVTSPYARSNVLEYRGIDNRRVTDFISHALYN